MPCAGDTTSLCGGPQRLNLYANTAPENPVANPTIANYTYAGCYIDSVNARVLSDLWVFDAAMTVEKCTAECAGYAWFGTEYAAECYCGNALRSGSGKVEDGECGMVCGGNGGQWCGSGNRLSVYRRNR